MPTLLIGVVVATGLTGFASLARADVMAPTVTNFTNGTIRDSFLMSGNANPGTTVIVRDEDGATYTTTASQRGTWSVDVDLRNNAHHEFTITSTDASGQSSGVTKYTYVGGTADNQTQTPGIPSTGEAGDSDDTTATVNPGVVATVLPGVVF
jgi:hypothetical protein